VENLKKEGVNNAVFQQLDIDNETSIAKFRDFIKATHGGIDILVNNAAIAYKHDATEPFHVQAEGTNRVNVFGTINVCNALFPLLRNHARVVHVSSSEGHLLKINGDEPAATELRAKFSSPSLTEPELKEMVNDFIKLSAKNEHSKFGWPNSTYKVSKVAVSALTRIHQRKFDETPEKDIVVNCCHPGYVNTDMTSGKGPLTVQQGSEAPIFLALLPPNVKEPRGGYVWYTKQIVDWVNGPVPTPL